MTYRILLRHLREILHIQAATPDNRYAAVTRPDAAVRLHQPSYCYGMRSLSNRSALARQLTGIEVSHG